MDTDINQVKRILENEQRYIWPPVWKDQFYICRDGDRHCLHDTILRRDIEYIHEPETGCGNPGSRERLLQEARIGTLGHPHLLPTLDFGVDRKTACWYFTRPLLNTIGFHELFWLSRSLPKTAQYLRVLKRTGWIEEFQQSLNAEIVRRDDEIAQLKARSFISEVRENEVWAQATPVMPSAKEIQQVKDERDRSIQQCKKFVARGVMSEEEAVAKLERMESEAFQKLLRATSEANRHSPWYGETPCHVVLGLRAFIEVLQKAYSAVAAVHQCDLVHSDLHPGAIRIGREFDLVFVTDWESAQSIKPGLSMISRAPVRNNFEIWNCTPPEHGASFDPTYDVFALGGILSFLIHKKPFCWEEPNTPPFRDVFVSSSQVSHTMIDHLLSSLQTVCREAQRLEPDRRSRGPSHMEVELKRILDVCEMSDDHG